MFPGSTDISTCIAKLLCYKTVNGFIHVITAALIIVVIATAVLMPGIQVTIDDWIVVYDVSAIVYTNVIGTVTKVIDVLLLILQSVFLLLLQLSMLPSLL